MTQRLRPVRFAAILVLAALACGLPGVRTPPPGPPTLEPGVTAEFGTPAAPTAIPEPLPAALVEMDPPSGSELGLTAPITFYFNQPIDRNSFMAALQGRPTLAGLFNWIDDQTVSFLTDSPYPADAELILQLDNTRIRTINGLPMLAPVEIHYRTAGYLRVSEILPEPGTTDADPASAIVVTFNRPVVPLASSRLSQPTAFSINPQANGKGEWINSSTYVFRPDPVLRGGVRYDIALNPELQSTAGGPLDPNNALPYNWFISTAPPEVLSWSPDPETISAPLDAEIRIQFNQAMDPGSLVAGFQLQAGDGDPVQGDQMWEDDQRTLLFRPSELLNRNQVYRLTIGEGARSAAGTPLEGRLETSFRTVGALSVTAVEPGPGDILRSFAYPAIYLNAPPDLDSLPNSIETSPAVEGLSANWDSEGSALRLVGRYEPDQSYAVSVSTRLRDRWGEPLVQPFSFRFQTASLRPSLWLRWNPGMVYVTPDDQRLPLQVTNVSRLDLSLGSLPLEDLLRMLAPDGDAFRQSYQPQNQINWSVDLQVPRNQSQTVDLSLSPKGDLSPGLYLLRLSSSELEFQPSPVLLVVSQAHLTVKAGSMDALVWAVDLQDNLPLERQTVRLINEAGEVLAEGRTDQNGIFQTPIPQRISDFEPIVAVLEGIGHEHFSLAMLGWDSGVSPWEQGVPYAFSPPSHQAYIYTDRPIYRPGQTVYYRGVLRWAFDARYRLPDVSSLNVNLITNQGQTAEAQNHSVSGLGTFHGEFKLDEAASPGWYRLETEFGDVPFQVAEFRKPEINLEIEISSRDHTAGEAVQAQLDARFFFGAPATNVDVTWQWYARRSHFDFPGYQVGSNVGELYQSPWASFYSPFGELVDSGTAQTDQEGRLELILPTRQETNTSEYLLEVTITDESGFPVSGRKSTTVHPADLYIGVRPSAWVGRSGEPIEFELQLVDWERKSVGDRQVTAQFQSVEWVRQDESDVPVFGYPILIPEYSPVASDTAQAGADGRLNFSFTPPEPGTYRFIATHGSASTDALLWVAGSGQPAWPALPNQVVQLTADRQSYLPGARAEIFIPNPFSSRASALITVERGRISRSQLVELEGSGRNYSILLREEDSPNVYVSAVLLGVDETGRPDFRLGVLKLPVESAEPILQLEVDLQPDQAGPGDTVTLGLHVTDFEGRPVQGEFSVAVVDLATLSLAEPNAEEIVTAYYGETPLGVRTGLGLANYALRLVDPAGGLGGGGGGDGGPAIRADFQDTAFWVGNLVTDASGRARVEITLPDNLTSWQVDVRGINRESAVGQAQALVTTSKPLLIRPVTPRFLVAGDRVEIAAVVHNNTDETLATSVTLQESGLMLEDSGSAVQEVLLPPHGQARVTWWGRVEVVDELDLVFRARGGEYEDASRPTVGPIPVIRYRSPHTAASTGVLTGSDEHLELVSLAHSYEPSGGELRVNLSPSLAAVALESLEVPVEKRDLSTEATVSQMLTFLETVRLLVEIDQAPPGLESQVAEIVASSIRRIQATQNADGGWSWWSSGRSDRQSDPFVSAYVLIGLSQVRGAGVIVPENVIENAAKYIQATVFSPQLATQTWQFNRLAFQHYALAQAGFTDPAGLAALYNIRALIGPWGRAFLGLALESATPGDSRAKTLIAELAAEASRTGSGAFWPLTETGSQNMSTGVLNTSVVAYALALRDPASPVLQEAVRYLIAARQPDGGWRSSFETSWALQALLAVLRGTGELGANFSFGATLNGSPLAQEALNGALSVTPVSVEVPLQNLRSETPNELRIRREEGNGRLYYLVNFEQYLPVELARSYARGASVERVYLAARAGCLSGACPPIQSGNTGEIVTVRLTLTLAEDVYYLHVEDHLPAGAEVLDQSLQTTRQGVDEALFDPRDPFKAGYGWWYFNAAQIYDDSIAWTADFVPAGTYELTYQLLLLQPGTFRVLPATAGPVYFPEITGQSAGAIFEIEPANDN